MAGYVSPERKALQTKSNIFVVVAIVLNLLSAALGQGAQAGQISPITWVFAPFVWGCWIAAATFYAKSKGYSPWYGALGALCCCGILILIIMPNKWVDAPASGYGPGDYPRPNA
jgi:Na+-driven multidrug efflux pump